MLGFRVHACEGLGFGELQVIRNLQGLKGLGSSALRLNYAIGSQRAVSRGDISIEFGSLCSFRLVFCSFYFGTGGFEFVKETLSASTHLRAPGPLRTQ